MRSRAPSGICAVVHSAQIPEHEMGVGHIPQPARSVPGKSPRRGWPMPRNAVPERLKSIGRSPVNTLRKTTSFHRLIARLGSELMPFEIIKARSPRGERYRGVQPILVERIIGSVDRHRDFDRYFRPKAQHLDDRWARIRQLWRAGYEFEPIKVFQVGEVFFLKDGNHRVSVGRSEGQVFIDAEVIEIDVLAPRWAGDRLADVAIKGQRAARLNACTTPLGAPA